MSINIEIYREDEEYKILKNEKFELINEYLNFDFNDIDLNKIWRILREGKNSNFLKNESNLNDSFIQGDYNRFYNPESDEFLGKHQLIEKNVYEDFNEIYSQITNCFLNINSYPYYKNTIFDRVKNKIYSYKDKKYKQIYFLILFLSKRKIILRKIKEFYIKKFDSNFQNSSVNKISKNSVGDILNYFSHAEKEKVIYPEKQIERDTNDITNTITLDILKSDKFKEFSVSLSNWYSLAESITLNLGLLNDYFGFKLLFEEDNFSLHNNSGFSLETFAKKNVLKLISYCLKKLTFNYKNFREFNYKRLIIMFASTFTYGISIKDFIFRDFKQFALFVKLLKFNYHDFYY
jgi:hypothetical protein